jgi:hypothetical protein
MNKIFEKILGYVACAILLVALAGITYWVEYQKQKDLLNQIDDLKVQLAHAQVPLKTDTIRDSIPVFTQQIIEIDKTDYKQQIADRQLIKDLGLKVDQLTSENKTLREARDTVFLSQENDSVYAYHDHWADFEYLTRQQLLKYAVRDSFDTFVNRVYKHRFLWWRWGTKGYEMKHVNYNPNVTIRYNRYIMIDK